MRLQPLPCAASRGVDYRMDIEAILARPFRQIRALGVKFAKMTNLRFGQFNLSMPFATVRSAVLDSIHAIIGSCCPPQMFLVNASPNPAIVSRVPQFGRARSMCDFTNQTSDSNILTFASNMRVSSAISRKGPKDAIVGILTQRIKNKAFGFRHILKLVDFRL